MHLGRDFERMGKTETIKKFQAEKSERKNHVGKLYVK
jgi:hypothetical protein